jgi:hypothetical protein
MTDHRTAEEAATALGLPDGPVGWTDRIGRPSRDDSEAAPAAVPAPDRSSTIARHKGSATTIVSTVLSFLLTYVASVWTMAGQKIENAGMAAAEQFGESTQAIWSIVYTTVSYSTLVFGLAVLALFGLRSGGLRRAIAAPSVLGAAIVGAELLKYVILPRPRLYVSPKWLGHPSFPSGHTTIAVGVAASALFVASDRTRRAVRLGGFVYAALMGISLIVTANHRLSDEIGSCLVVLLSATVASMMLPHHPHDSLRRGRPRTPLTLATVLGLLIAIRLFAGVLTNHGYLTVAAGCIGYVIVCAATLSRISVLADRCRPHRG